MVVGLPCLQRTQVTLGVLDASLLAEGLDGVGAALDGALLEGLGTSRVLALGKRPGSQLGMGIADGEVPLVLGRVVFLAGVGNGAGDEGQARQLGEGNHCDLRVSVLYKTEKEWLWEEREKRKRAVK